MILRALILVALVGATIAACFLRNANIGVSEAGVVLDLPSSIGDFWGTDQPVSKSELALLPGDTQFAKKLYKDARGNQVNSQIVLAGGEKRSIHRPEICLPGQGWRIKDRAVLSIPIEGGEPLEVTRLRISRPITLPNGEETELESYFLYWFVGKDTTTPHHLVRIARTNLDMLLHNTNHRWAYVIVSAPILEKFVPGAKDGPETLEMLKSFISEVYPQIRKQTAQKES